MNDLQSLPRSKPVSAAAPSPTSYIRASKAKNTQRAYRSDWRDFEAWCEDRSFTTLPAQPEVIASYLTWLAESGVKAVTIQRRLAAIRFAHETAGAGNPGHDWGVRETMRGIRRTHGTAPTKNKAPISASELRRLVATCNPETKAGVRDRAILLTAWLGALRRSELVSFDVSDVRWDEEGMVLTIRRSKTDQEGMGEVVGIPYRPSPPTCAVRALKAWLEIAGITEGPVFRGVNRHDQIGSTRLTDGAVAGIIKRAALRAGMDSTKVAGHSPRAGHATQAARDGVIERAIQKQGRWKSVQTLRARYIKHATIFEENSAGLVRL